MLLGVDRRPVAERAEADLQRGDAPRDSGRGAEGPYVAGSPRLPAGPARRLAPAPQQRPLAARGAGATARARNHGR
jgi:hypothetical protein